MTFGDFSVLAVFGIPLYAVGYSDRVRSLGDAIDSSLTRAVLSHKAAACIAEIDEAQWTRLRRLLGLLGRLVSLPPAFWIELLPRLGQIVGVSVRIESDDDRHKRLTREALIEYFGEWRPKPIAATLREQKEPVQCELFDDSSAA
jgi:hypothetical protein